MMFGSLLIDCKGMLFLVNFDKKNIKKM